MAQRRGMTLVEAMLALFLTVVIGLIATTVTVAMLDLRQSTDTYNQNVQSARVSLARMQKIIRTSRVIVDGDQTSMTLWAFDEDDPGVMNAEEVVRLTYSPGDEAVLMWFVDFQDRSPRARDALNIPITLDTGSDWNQTRDLMNTSHLQVQEVATELSSIQFHYDTSPPYAIVVAIDAAFGNENTAGVGNDGREAAYVHTAATLRSPKTSDSELAEAGYTGTASGGESEEDLEGESDG
ncbi:MAG: PilW family protein [Planctomycetota bacterium]